jgi:acyl-CoA synthetase (AMP-forming)/AMP-acid ligase II/acyl carrier protein
LTISTGEVDLYDTFPALQQDSILSLLQETTTEHQNAVALYPAGGNPVTYRSLQRRVTALIASLRNCGVTGGKHASRVAIVMANGVDLSITILGTCCAGVALPFNTGYKADEYRDYFARTRTEFLLVSSDENGPAVAVAEQAGIRVLRMGRDVIRVDVDPPESAPPTPMQEEPEKNDIAIILLTAGSTGLGKSVPLTHDNLCVSVREVCHSTELGPGDRCLSMWEQFHIGGVVDLLLAPLASGGQIISTGGFDTVSFFELLRSHEPTWFQGVPTTLGELCRHARINEIDTSASSLRFIRSVASALPEPLMREVEERFGVPVIQTFGMTEAAPLITSNRLPPGQRKPESAGISWGTKVIIMDNHGQPLPVGEQGHIAIHGDNVFSGYEGDDQANTESFRNGWFYTGDLGYLDADEYLFLTGRAKEIINRGGEKISPAEIDKVLIEHPDIEEAAAFGIPHATLGEDIAAAIVLKPGLTTTLADLQAFVAKRLAPFKNPRHISFLTELPRCPVGKVRRRELTRRMADETNNAPHRGPKNPMETVLMELWAAELEPDSIGIDDDFAALGGDSLSSVRILLAAELMFNIKISDDAAASFNTVENMAAALVRMGVSADMLPGRTTTSDLDSQGKSRVEEVISATDQILMGINTAHRTLYSCQTKADFQTLTKTRETLDTPRESHTWLSDTPSWHTFFRLTFRSLATIRLAYRRRQYRRKFFKEFELASNPMGWNRHAVGENDYLFSASSQSASVKTLICAFSGTTMRLMMSISRILFSLDPDQYDVLLLIDPEHKHFEGGTRGVDGQLYLTARRLDKYATDNGYQRVVALGTSAGGLAAIGIAMLNRWSKALVFGADRPSRHPHFTHMIEQVQSESIEPSSTPVTVSFAAHNQRDREAAGEIELTLPFATLLPDERFSGHAIAYSIYKAGELKNFLSEHL